MIGIGILAAFVAVVLWSISQLISKAVAPKLGTSKTAALVVSAGILPMLLLFLISPAVLSVYNTLLSVAAGVPLAVGYILFYKSVESQNISNISGIDLLQPAVLAVYGIFVLSEPINRLQIIGTIAVFIGIALISKKKDGKFNRRLIPAALGNVVWAFYWIILSSVISSSNQYVLPLLISRITAAIITIFALGFLLSSGNRSRLKADVGRTLKLSLAAVIILGFIEAMFDGGGNIIFGIVVNNGALALGAVLTALQPALIAFAAYYIYKERLTKVQTIGIIAAIAGALLIAIF